jgi:predicted metal-binding membrane protein
MPAGNLEALLKRDRAFVIAGLVGIATISWVYMFHLAREMGTSTGMEMSVPRMQGWGAVDFVLMFIMWSVMMVAMMTPSAAPMILTYSRVNRQRHEQRSPLMATGAFLAGYLVVWTGFSAVATLAQWELHRAALLSPMMVSNSPLLGGTLLIGAGVFQFTPLKRACLAHCRSPLGFFMTEWREGTRGAFLMGIRHGAFCVGCCWLLMALLFVAGVMNLLWVAGIAAFVLVEKIVPAGHWVSLAIGLCVIAGGLWMVTGTFF